MPPKNTRIEFLNFSTRINLYITDKVSCYGCITYPITRLFVKEFPSALYKWQCFSNPAYYWLVGELSTLPSSRNLFSSSSSFSLSFSALVSFFFPDFGGCHRNIRCLVHLSDMSAYIKKSVPDNDCVYMVFTRRHIYMSMGYINWKVCIRT